MLQGDRGKEDEENHWREKLLTSWPELDEWTKRSWGDPRTAEDFAAMMLERQRLRREQRRIAKIRPRYEKAMRDAEELVKRIPVRPDKIQGFTLFVKETRAARPKLLKKLSTDEYRLRWAKLSAEEQEEFNRRAIQPLKDYKATLRALYKSFKPGHWSIMRRYLQHKPMARTTLASDTEKLLRDLPTSPLPPTKFPPVRGGHYVWTPERQKWNDFMKAYRLQHPNEEGEPHLEWFQRTAKAASKEYKALKAQERAANAALPSEEEEGEEEGEEGRLQD